MNEITYEVRRSLRGWWFVATIDKNGEVIDVSTPFYSEAGAKLYKDFFLTPDKLKS